jgi:hypothetical protein
MGSNFLPAVSADVLKEKIEGQDAEAFFEFLVEPLHEELYKKQDFTFVDELSQGQQLLLSYDYVRMQVLQGGFIQLIQNGYIGLLPSMPGWLADIGIKEMAKVIDDVLKVYVLNRELLDKQTTVEEFAQLYNELGEFEILDDQFTQLNDHTIKRMLDNAKANISEFVKIV